MKITQTAANRGSGDFNVKPPAVLVQKDLTTPPPPRSLSAISWNKRTNEVEITLTGEKTRGSTYEYTTTLTVSDLLRCLEAVATWMDAAEKAVSLSAIAFLRVLLARKPTPPPRRANTTKPVRP